MRIKASLYRDGKEYLYLNSCQDKEKSQKAVDGITSELNLTPLVLNHKTKGQLIYIPYISSTIAQRYRAWELATPGWDE